MITCKSPYLWTNTRQPAATFESAVFESLEGRRLLSHGHFAGAASLSNAGELNVAGTRHSDAIIISVDATDATKLDVSINGKVIQFDLAAVMGIKVTAGNGSDLVKVDQTDGNIGCELDGGNGNDTLVGGSGNETLNGGNGNDLENGGAGDDQVNGDNGNDSLLGMDGNDTLLGGRGNDEMDGGMGMDDCFGGRGQNTFHGDDNPSELKDQHEGDVQVTGTYSGDDGETDASVVGGMKHSHKGMFAN